MPPLNFVEFVKSRNDPRPITMWDEPDMLGDADEDSAELIENPAFGRFDLSLSTLWAQILPSIHSAPTISFSEFENHVRISRESWLCFLSFV